MPTEVEGWVNRTQQEIDYNSHHSQMQALKVMMDVFHNRQQEILKTLDSITDTVNFQQNLYQLIGEIIKAQRIWDFFRDKLELRLYPNFKEPLTIADTVAWDCYRSTLEEAKKYGIITSDRFREPPLTYLTAEFSPATWVRGSRPNDGRDYYLGTVKLPIPVIEIPWDHVVNFWEFLSLHHEVGHDLEADLSLRTVLRYSLDQQLRQAGVPEARISIWLAWEGEIFADLVGLLLAGPAFAYSMVHLLLLPHNVVTTYNADDPHPSHYLRIFINTTFIKTLLPGNQNMTKDAEHLEQVWKQLYGDISHLGVHKVEDFKKDFDIVYKALIDTAFDTLKGHSIRELIPFTSQNDAKIRAAADFLVTGQNMPTDIFPRHVISASRLAMDKIMSKPGDHNKELNNLNKLTADLIKRNTPEGLRAVEDSQKHREFIRSLAESI